ncbi:MAG: substrate-binding domain-containing protein [Oscillospiraceae bacterium]|nr:substrate-binding domain-containing protein [Oscillospiraceae bacterium]
MELQRRIGIIMGKVYKEVNHAQLCGILEQAYARGFSAFVFTLTAENGEAKIMQGEENLFSLINFSMLDGIIYLPYTFSADEYREYIEAFLVHHCPKPMISISMESGFCPNIWYDDRLEFSEVVNHLIEEHGCRKIHCLTGNQGQPVAEQRLAGYRDAMERAGLPVGEEDVTYGDFWKYAALQLAEEFACGARQMPDAVVCANDIMAIALCDAFKEYGVSVPEDVLVAGYDGTLESRIHSLPVTTYSTSWKQLGRNAMCMLYEMITGEPSPCEQYEQGKLFCRKSCGCVKDMELTGGERFDYQRLEDNFTDSNLSTQFLTADSLHSFIQKTYHMTYVFLKLEQCGSEMLTLCFCEDWDRAEIDGYTRTYRTKGYSDRMIWIDFEGTRRMFLTAQMVPEQVLEIKEPSVTFFTAMHFQDRCFGYALLTLKGMADGFNQHYLHFCREINNGLEFLCIQNELKSLAYRRYLSQIRDELTGLYNRSSFNEKWTQLREKAKTYHEECFILGFSLSGLHRIKETCGSLERDKYLVEFSDILRNCCQNQEMCFRAREGEFLVIGSQKAGGQLHQTVLSRITMQFDKQYQPTEYSFRPRLYHVTVTDCTELLDGEQTIRMIAEMLQNAQKGTLTYSEQMHYDDLAMLRNEIYQFPENDWSVTLCCQKLNISSSYFQRIYRNTFGVSCAHDIQKSKLDHAKKLLLNTTDTLQTIARKCGYDYSHFMRTFKKEIGMTPTEYRRGKMTGK